MLANIPEQLTFSKLFILQYLHLESNVYFYSRICRLQRTIFLLEKKRIGTYIHIYVFI